MHGLMPYRHVPLQVEIDRANGALQTCNSAIDQYQVNPHSQLFFILRYRVPAYLPVNSKCSFLSMNLVSHHTTAYRLWPF